MTPRAFFETQLLPAFADRFGLAATIINVGAGRHAYREYFRCRVVTADPVANCDERWRAEAIPHADDSVDGIVLMGVFERLDDPVRAIAELRRILRPGGVMLMSALDLGCPARKSCDRWRVSAAGAAHVVREFTVLDQYHIGGQAHFFVLQKG